MIFGRLPIPLPLQAGLDEYRRRVRPVTLCITAFVACNVDVVVYLAFQDVHHAPHQKYIEDVLCLSTMYVTAPAVALILGRRKNRLLWYGVLSGSSLVSVAALVIASTLTYQIAVQFLEDHTWLFVHPIGKSPISVYNLILGAPFFEELGYQVGLQTALERFRVPLAIFITTVLFTAGHIATAHSLQWLFIDLFPSLLIFALIWHRYRSFGACFLAHAGHNAVLILCSPSRAAP